MRLQVLLVLLPPSLALLRNPSLTVGNTQTEQRSQHDVCLITTDCFKLGSTFLKDGDDFAGVAGYLLATLGQMSYCHERGRPILVTWPSTSQPSSCGAGDCWEVLFQRNTTAEQKLRGKSALCTSPWEPFMNNEHANEIARDKQLRASVAQLAQVHLTPSKVIADRVTSFRMAHLKGRHVLGVQVRATDYSQEFGEELVSEMSWISKIQRRFESMQDPKVIFVASDNNHMIKIIKDKFGAHQVVHSTAMRVEGRENGQAGDWFHCNGAGNVLTNCVQQQWRDVLTDIFLLAHTDELVYWEGSVAKLAMLLNPALKVTPVLESERTPMSLLQKEGCDCTAASKKFGVYMDRMRQQ